MEVPSPHSNRIGHDTLHNFYNRFRVNNELLAIMQDKNCHPFIDDLSLKIHPRSMQRRDWNAILHFMLSPISWVSDLHRRQEHGLNTQLIINHCFSCAPCVDFNIKPLNYLFAEVLSWPIEYIEPTNMLQTEREIIMILICPKSIAYLDIYYK